MKASVGTSAAGFCTRIMVACTLIASRSLPRFIATSSAITVQMNSSS